MQIIICKAIALTVTQTDASEKYNLPAFVGVGFIKLKKKKMITSILIATWYIALGIGRIYIATLLINTSYLNKNASEVYSI